MEEETCVVTYSIGSIVKETEIKVEKSHGESYTLKGDKAKISTVMATLSTEGWKLEQSVRGIPEIFIFKRPLTR
jgi:hypothetical protein